MWLSTGILLWGLHPKGWLARPQDGGDRSETLGEPGWGWGGRRPYPELTLTPSRSAPGLQRLRC